MRRAEATATSKSGRFTPACGTADDQIHVCILCVRVRVCASLFSPSSVCVCVCCLSVVCPSPSCLSPSRSRILFILPFNHLLHSFVHSFIPSYIHSLPLSFIHTLSLCVHPSTHFISLNIHDTTTNGHFASDSHSDPGAAAVAVQPVAFMHVSKHKKSTTKAPSKGDFLFFLSFF